MPIIGKAVEQTVVRRSYGAVASAKERPPVHAWLQQGALLHILPPLFFFSSYLYHFDGSTAVCWRNLHEAVSQLSERGSM